LGRERCEGRSTRRSQSSCSATRRAILSRRSVAHQGRSYCNLGARSVLDFEPREATEDEISLLIHLAIVVMDELELRLAARRALSQYHQELARRELREDQCASARTRTPLRTFLQWYSRLRSRQFLVPKASTTMLCA
jgi:hypothetical protein